MIQERTFDVTGCVFACLFVTFPNDPLIVSLFFQCCIFPPFQVRPPGEADSPGGHGAFLLFPRGSGAREALHALQLADRPDGARPWPVDAPGGPILSHPVSRFVCDSLFFFTLSMFIATHFHFLHRILSQRQIKDCCPPKATVFYFCSRAKFPCRKSESVLA